MSQESTHTSGTSVQDRQRDRATRGIRARISPSANAGDRPSPPRRRRPAIAALAVLLIIGGAALAGLLALRLDSRDPVVVLNQDVPVGTQITTKMLSSTNIASDRLLLVPESEVDSVLGTYARTALSQGQLLDTSMLSTAAPFGSDQMQVGVPLTSGQVPPGLRTGDEVRLIRIGDGSTAAYPIAVGLLLSTVTPESGGSFGSEGGIASATVLVPAESADEVVDAAGSDLLGIALIKRGVAMDEANLTPLDSGL